MKCQPRLLGLNEEKHPDGGNRKAVRVETAARFDEGELEIQLLATAPALYSTVRDKFDDWPANG